MPAISNTAATFFALWVGEKSAEFLKGRLIWLSIFGGSLTRLYLTSPGTRREGSIAPSQQGVGLAKDSWMLAIGVALVLDGLFGSRKGRKK